jgi:hypothetical protein
VRTWLIRTILSRFHDKGMGELLAAVVTLILALVMRGGGVAF